MMAIGVESDFYQVPYESCECRVILVPRATIPFVLVETWQEKNEATCQISGARFSKAPETFRARISNLMITELFYRIFLI